MTRGWGWGIGYQTVFPRLAGSPLTAMMRGKYSFYAEFGETRVYE